MDKSNLERKPLIANEQLSRNRQSGHKILSYIPITGLLVITILENYAFFTIYYLVTSDINSYFVPASSRLFSSFAYMIPLFGGCMVDMIMGRYNGLIFGCVTAMIGTLIVLLTDFMPNTSPVSHQAVGTLGSIIWCFGFGFIIPTVIILIGQQVHLEVDQHNQLLLKPLHSVYLLYYIFRNIGNVLSSLMINKILEVSLPVVLSVASMTGCVLLLLVMNQKTKHVPVKRRQAMGVFQDFQRNPLEEHEAISESSTTTNSHKYLRIYHIKRIKSIYTKWLVWFGAITLYALVQYELMYWNAARKWSEKTNTFYYSCLIYTDGLLVIALALLLIFCHQFLSFHLSIFKKIGIGIIFIVFAALASGIMELVPKREIIEHWYRVMLNFMRASSEIFVLPPAYELVYQLSPKFSRCNNMGFFLFAIGLGQMIGYAISLPMISYKSDDYTNSTNSDNIISSSSSLGNYYMLLAVIGIISFIIFLGFSKFGVTYPTTEEPDNFSIVTRSKEDNQPYSLYDAILSDYTNDTTHTTVNDS